MRATVCQLPAVRDREGLEESWRSLAAHVREEGSDLVLLPEMPFHPWLPASPRPDMEAWRAAVEAHDRWMDRFPELGGAAVAGSRPVVGDGRAGNEAFVWEPDGGYRPAGWKRHLPEEPGFREASWYEPAPPGPFRPLELAGGVRVGFLVCTDLWFGRHARELAREGAHLVLSPRATPVGTLEKWVVGGRAAAVVSGAWCLSSNFSGPGGAPGDDAPLEFAGGGWIVEPEAGEVVGLTDARAPFLTRDLDPAAAEAAKGTYPRYVE